jgi:thiosulfate dehydrogenase
MERAMKHRGPIAMVAACLLAAAAACGPSSPEPASPSSPRASSPADSTSADAPRAPDGSVDVLLCDGKTTESFAAGTPGTVISASLMDAWLKKNPNSNWAAEERERHTLQPAADNAALVDDTQGQTYGRVTQQDVTLWKTETEKLALAGSRVFHSGDELGSTVGVSCDMCHPHAANTHPETYPKFQQQLGRVVLLRDMINWCMQHPVRAKALEADDPRMRAMEAYIYAQRKGKALEYGKQ